MKFTVVIPVYNGEKFISKSILSVLNQTYADVELIVVDDGSSDRTSEAVNEIIGNYKTKNVIFKSIENSGPSTARNIGIELAHGDYICFLDADDQYKNNLFSDLSEVLHGEDVCFFGWEERNDNNSESLFNYEDKYRYLDKTITGPEAAVLKFKHEIWLCNCNEVYSLNLLKRHNIRYMENVYSGEDANFIYKCLINSKGVISLQGNYFINYIRTDSLMHSAFSLKSLTEFDACKDLYEYSIENKYDKLICDMFFTLYYNSRIYVAKRIARSLKWYQSIKFSKYCKKYIPKINKARDLLLTKKEKMETMLYKSKAMFLLIYKFFISRKKR